MIPPCSLKRGVLVVIALTGLLVVFVFQHVDYLAMIAGNDWRNLHPEASFVVNRVVRVILNDSFCLLLIASLFRRPDFNQLAWWVFLIELFVILPAYLLIKLSVEGPSEISSPLLQPIHRMIVNPLLMIILIGGFYLLRWHSKVR